MVQFQQINALLKGLRNGLEYGSKVRFVHTLVMVLLFKDISIHKAPSLLKNILSMAIQHGKNLGLFVLLYKLGYKLLNRINATHSLNHLLSGCIFGALIFGKTTGVNHQINLYLLSRVSVGLMYLLYKQIGKLKAIKLDFIQKGYGYYLMAAVCWGIVMWLFEKDKSLLQPSLRTSMEFLYKESDQVSSLKQLIPYYPKTKKCIKKQHVQKDIASNQK